MWQVQDFIYESKLAQTSNTEWKREFYKPNNNAHKFQNLKISVTSFIGDSTETFQFPVFKKKLF